MKIAEIRMRIRRAPLQLRVLTYHRVAGPSEQQLLDPRLISTTPEQFTLQMEYLARAHHVVPLESVVRAVATGAPLPPKATLLTFDDGYFDLAEHAFPTLARLGLPAVVFVPTAFADAPGAAFWWDRLHAALVSSRVPEVRCPGLGPLQLPPGEGRMAVVRRVHNHLKGLPHADLLDAVEAICGLHAPSQALPRSVLSWDELRTWSARGIAVAAHSRTHPILTKLPIAEAEHEVVGSQSDIARSLGTSYPVFCYPNGSVGPDVRALLRKAGFAVAFTTTSGRNDLASCDPLRLNRQSVYRRSVLPVFRFRMTGLGATMDAWRGRRALARGV